VHHLPQSQAQQAVQFTPHEIWTCPGIISSGRQCLMVEAGLCGVRSSPDLQMSHVWFYWQMRQLRPTDASSYGRKRRSTMVPRSELSIHLRSLPSSQSVFLAAAVTSYYHQLHLPRKPTPHSPNTRHFRLRTRIDQTRPHCPLPVILGLLAILDKFHRHHFLFACWTLQS
jgi:hypothetical protein